MQREPLHLFFGLAHHGSLARTARTTGLFATTVSERLNTLETYYGLLHTRRPSPQLPRAQAGWAQAGWSSFERAPRPLTQAEQALCGRRLGTEVLAGPLRISAPIILGRERIAPLLDAFLLAHPGVTAELLLIEDNGIEDNGADHRRADPAVDGLSASVDIAVQLSTSGDSSLQVHRVGRNRRLVIASPDYLEAHGAPKSPTDLAHHNCLCAQSDSHWAFQESGRAFVVAVSGDRVASDPALVRRWCLQGRGLALESEWHVADDLARGRLVQVLSDYAPAPGALQVVLPPGRAPSRQVEVFADVLTSALQG